MGFGIQDVFRPVSNAVNAVKIQINARDIDIPALTNYSAPTFDYNPCFDPGFRDNDDMNPVLYCLYWLFTGFDGIPDSANPPGDYNVNTGINNTAFIYTYMNQLNVPSTRRLQVLGRLWDHNFITRPLLPGPIHIPVFFDKHVFHKWEEKSKEFETKEGWNTKHKDNLLKP